MKYFLYLRKFLLLTGTDKKLVIKVFANLLFFTLLIRWFKAKHYYSYFKRNTSNKLNNDFPEELALKVKKSINILSKILPWEITCLVKSLVFKQIMRKLNVECNIIFQVLKNSNKDLIAHSVVIWNNQICYLNNRQFLQTFEIKP